MENDLGVQIVTGITTIIASLVLAHTLFLRTNEVIINKAAMFLTRPFRLTDDMALTKWSKRPWWLWWTLCSVAGIGVALVVVPTYTLATLMMFWTIIATLYLVLPNNPNDPNIFSWEVVQGVVIIMCFASLVIMLLWFSVTAIKGYRVIRLFRQRGKHLFAGRTYRGNFAQDA